MIQFLRKISGPPLDTKPWLEDTIEGIISISNSKSKFPVNATEFLHLPELCAAKRGIKDKMRQAILQRRSWIWFQTKRLEFFFFFLRASVHLCAIKKQFSNQRATHSYWGSGCRCWPPRCPRRGTRSRVKPCCSPPFAPLRLARRASRASHTRPVLRDGSLRGKVHGRARGRPRWCAVGGRPQVREASK